MTPKTLFLLLLAVFTAASLPAQSWDLRGPAMGLDYNAEARTLRPILGIPGAASLGAALEISTPWTRAYLPPAARFAILETADGLVLFVPGESDLVPLPAAKPDLIAFSPDNSTAVLYFSQPARLLSIAGLPRQPHVVQDMEAPAPLAALAINDSGSMILAAPTADAGSGVLLISAGGAARNLLPSLEAVSLSFTAQRSGALVLTKAPHAVYLFSDLNGAEQLLPLFTTESEELTAAALSVDGRFLVTASGSGAVRLTNLADQSSRTLACSCQPDALLRLPGAATFRLTSAAPGPIWVLDAAGDEPRIVFIPRGEER